MYGILVDREQIISRRRKKHRDNHQKSLLNEAALLSFRGDLLSAVRAAFHECHIFSFLFLILSTAVIFSIFFLRDTELRASRTGIANLLFLLRYDWFFRDHFESRTLPASTLWKIRRTNTSLRFRLKKLLHHSILTGMKRDDRDPSSFCQSIRRHKKKCPQSLKLPIHLDTKRLKHLGRRMNTERSPLRRRK